MSCTSSRLTVLSPPTDPFTYAFAHFFIIIIFLFFLEEEMAPNTKVGNRTRDAEFTQVLQTGDVQVPSGSATASKPLRTLTHSWLTRHFLLTLPAHAGD